VRLLLPLLAPIVLGVLATHISVAAQETTGGLLLTPVTTTASVPDDADDPAVWINSADPANSLILGTNKVAAPSGALYVFGLDGGVRQVFAPLDRPNNVDVEYGLQTESGPIDIAVVTERLRSRLRVFRVEASGITSIDAGGVPVLDGESGEAAMPMGISLYRRPGDGAIFAIVAPKTGGTTRYLWQYRLTMDAATQSVRGTLVRRFGSYSGSGEIEAVAVDDEPGYVYYSDEEFALHKWRADPDAPDADVELAAFGRDGFKQQREGLAILARPDGTGFIVCSDQIAGGTELRVFRREGQPGRPHDHDPAVAVIRTMADSTDGLEVIAAPLGPRFPHGLLVMMNSAGRNFQMYDWRAVESMIRADSPR
jgi:3-phytase